MCHASTQNPKGFILYHKDIEVLFKVTRSSGVAQIPRGGVCGFSAGINRQAASRKARQRQKTLRHSSRHWSLITGLTTVFPPFRILPASLGANSEMFRLPIVSARLAAN